jgi:hypothetical protein
MDECVLIHIFLVKNKHIVVQCHYSELSKILHNFFIEQPFYLWAKKYKFINKYDIIQVNHDGQYDTFVLSLMELYGIDNVRGNKIIIYCTIRNRLE